MIGPGAGARVMVATRPVDFRKGPDALAALVGAEYGGDPYSGVIYVFRAKRADRIKPAQLARPALVTPHRIARQSKRFRRVSDRHAFTQTSYRFSYVFHGCHLHSPTLPVAPASLGQVPIRLGQSG